MGHLGSSNPIGGVQSSSSFIGGGQFNSHSLLPNFSNVQFQNAGQMLGNAESDAMSFNSSPVLAQMQHLQNNNGNQVGSQNHWNQQFRGGMGNTDNLGPVKVERQMGPTDHDSPMQQLQAMQNLSQVKLEPQQLQSLRSLGTVKMEPQQCDVLALLQQQQQQRVQLQQQMNQRSLPIRAAQVRPAGVYEPGMCARRLTHYMYHQQHRPNGNNIEFWRKFVSEYFAPNAKKRWCVSLYGGGHQMTGVFPQDVWHCEMCNRKPGRGFETTVEVLPRLWQIKYASGTLEELLYVDMPREYQNASGQIVLEYAKAIQESVFEQLRVVRDGQLRIVFNPDLKISSWEFCARRHEELIPRSFMISQISQLGVIAHKYQAASQNASSGLSGQDLQTLCSSFVASARQLAKSLEVPLVNDLGYTKRYVRCLQISEVVNSMKDLIDYSGKTGRGPMDSLINFPRKTSGSSGLHHQQAQQPSEHQQSVSHNSNHNDHGSYIPATTEQHATVGNGISSANDSVNAPSSLATSTVTVPGLRHQNSMISRQEIPMGNTVQIPPASSLSSNNNNRKFSNTPASMSAVQHGATQCHEEVREPQSSVQQIVQEMMLSSQLNGIIGTLQSLSGADRLAVNGIRAGMVKNGMAVNGRAGMNHMLSHQQQQEMRNRLLSGLGAANNVSNLQFDWKTSS